MVHSCGTFIIHLRILRRSVGQVSGWMRRLQVPKRGQTAFWPLISPWSDTWSSKKYFRGALELYPKDLSNAASHISLQPSGREIAGGGSAPPPPLGGGGCQAGRILTCYCLPCHGGNLSSVDHLRPQSMRIQQPLPKQNKSLLLSSAPCRYHGIPP